jgi:hypothetical protein
VASMPAILAAPEGVCALRVPQRRPPPPGPARAGCGRPGEDGQRTMMIASIRYHDELIKQDGQWLFAGRRLMVDWTETRPPAA